MNKEEKLKKYLEESSADKIWKDYFEGQFSCNTIMLSSIVSTRKENENLQQENKQLEEDIKYHNTKRTIYCNRINKCVEYIKKIKKNDKHLDYLFDVLIGNHDEVLNKEDSN